MCVNTKLFSNCFRFVFLLCFAFQTHNSSSSLAFLAQNSVPRIAHRPPRPADGIARIAEKAEK